MQKIKVDIKLDKRLAVTCCIIGVFVLTFFVVMPFQVKRILTANSRSGELKKKITQVKHDIAAKDSLIREKVNLEKEIMELESKSISLHDISSIQVYISTKAKEHGLEVSEMSAAMPVKYKQTTKGQFMSVPVTLEARCGFHNLGRFLDQIEKSEYFIEVVKVDIAGMKPYHKVNIEFMSLMKE